MTNEQKEIRRLNAIIDRFLGYHNEQKAEIREWAAYCRAVQPGPNLADRMLAYIGDPPHDYTNQRRNEAMKTISELVRAQVLAEGPPHEDVRRVMVYVDETIDAMDNTELLDRISDAIASQSDRGADGT